MKGITRADKKRMFLSDDTYEGLLITVHSITEIILFLLNSSAKYVLTSHFNQGNIEQEFNQQRDSCGGHENPSIQQFGYNARKLNASRRFIIQKKTGNTTRETSELV